MTIRVDMELARLIRAAASRCGLDASDIARRTLRWCNSHVEQLKNRHCSTVEGGTMGFRDLELGDITPDQFRWALHKRCTEAVRAAAEPFTTTLKEGVDYIVRR